MDVLPLESLEQGQNLGSQAILKAVKGVCVTSELDAYRC